MASPSARHVTSTTERDVLVLTITEPQLHGDRLIRALDHQLKESTARPDVKKVVLDLRHVTALSSAALRPLVGLRRNLEAKGGQLVVCNLATVVAETFRATRLLSTSRISSSAGFAVQPTLDAALASLRTDETAE
jgi:anti-anti-sigma factor